MRIRAAALAICVVVLAACGDDPVTVEFEVIEEVTFDASLGIDLAQMTKLPEGVYIQDVVVGTGAVIAANDSVTIDHTGWLSDGFAFTSGVFPFRFRADPLIEGFELGMEGMAVGGSRRMIIPPELAYGAEGARNRETGAVVVPPGAVLVFEVELQTIHP